MTLSKKDNERKWGVHGQKMLLLSIRFFKDIQAENTRLGQDEDFNNKTLANLINWLDSTGHKKFVESKNASKVNTSLDDQENIQDFFPNNVVKDLFISPLLISDSFKTVPVLLLDQPEKPKEPSELYINEIIVKALENSEVTKKFKQRLGEVFNETKELENNQTDLMNSFVCSVIKQAIKYPSLLPKKDTVLYSDALPSINFESIAKTVPTPSFMFKKKKRKKLTENNGSQSSGSSSVEPEFLSKKQLSKGFRNSISTTSKVISSIIVELYDFLSHLGFKYEPLDKEDFEKSIRILERKMPKESNKEKEYDYKMKVKQDIQSSKKPLFIAIKPNSSIPAKIPSMNYITSEVDIPNPPQNYPFNPNMENYITSNQSPAYYFPPKKIANSKENWQNGSFLKTNEVKKPRINNFYGQNKNQNNDNDTAISYYNSQNGQINKQNLAQNGHIKHQNLAQNGQIIGRITSRFQPSPEPLMAPRIRRNHLQNFYINSGQITTGPTMLTSFLEQQKAGLNLEKMSHMNNISPRHRRSYAGSQFDYDFPTAQNNYDKINPSASKTNSRGIVYSRGIGLKGDNGVPPPPPINIHQRMFAKANVRVE